MAVINTGSHPKALWPGVKRWWGTEYKRYTPIWPKMFEQFNSDQNYEEDVEDVGFGLMQTKNQGTGIYFDTTQQGNTTRYTHITYGLGYVVTMEELQDNLYEKVSFKRVSRLARSVYETEEIIHASVFNRAFNSSFVGGDAVSMMSTAHPTASGNQSNQIATAADLSEASIEDMVVQIMNAQDSRGLQFQNNPKQLLIPSAERFNAIRILKSTQQNDTANNAINAINSLNLLPEVVWSPYFTDQDAWFIRTDCPEGLTHYNRMEATFDKDNDFDTKNLKASVVMRFVAGWTNWRQIFGSPGA